MSKSEAPLLIIGSGLAGLTVAKELRKLQPDTPLTVITEEAGHFYSKPMLSTALNQGKTPQSLIMTEASTLQSQLGATFYCHSQVEAIDPENKTVTVKTRQETLTLSYQKLIFALGAQPKPLPLLDNLSACFRINHLEQYGHFIEAIANKKQLTIIGSGLVGCEFAHDLSHKDYDVSLVTPDPYPLFGLIPEQAGHYLQKALIEKGVQWHAKTNLVAAKNDAERITLSLSSDIHLQPEAILCAIGLQPNIDLANKANIKVNKGIVVDNYLRTSQADIYALGDCAEIEGVCRQFVAPILHCARTLARTLSGDQTPVTIPPTPIVLKVNAYPLVVFPPEPTLSGQWEIEDNDGSIHGTFMDKDGVLQGYVLTGKETEHRQILLKKLMANLTPQMA